MYFSPGIYLSGTITLKDNVTFQLESGATLLGSTDLADYRPQPRPSIHGHANAKRAQEAIARLSKSPQP